MANDYLEATRVFHTLTSHSYTSVRSSPHVLDWENKPLPYKIYPDAAALSLPRDLELPALAALEATRADDAPRPTRAAPSLANLARILFGAGGLTHRKRMGGEDYHFRAAPSAGALYPIEIYVASAEIEGLESGLYHFSPADLRLRGLRRGDWRAALARNAADAALADAAVVAILTAVFWRSTWKYRARAYRYCLWDAGTMIANLLACARGETLDARVVSHFADGEVEALLGIDGDREGVLAMVALGGAKAAAEAETVAPLELESIPLSDHEVVYDDLVKIHRESRLEADEVAGLARASVALSANAPDAQARIIETLAPDSGLGLGTTILTRGSTRVFAQEPIDASELASIMSVGGSPAGSGLPRLTETYLIVNAVEGLESGAYYYRPETAGFELLKAGDFRGEAGYLCLEQPLGADCSVLIIYMADLERALASLGNRAYRDVHLEAGVMGGRAYLAAYALGRGATGLTFYDDDTTKFLSPHARGKSPIFMVAVGVPGSRSH